MGRQGLPHLSDGCFESGAIVLDDGWRDDDVAVEISKPPLGTRLGPVTTDHAEVFAPYLLGARVDAPARLLRDLLGRGSRPFALASRNHCHASEKGEK